MDDPALSLWAAQKSAAPRLAMFEAWELPLPNTLGIPAPPFNRNDVFRITDYCDTSR